MGFKSPVINESKVVFPVPLFPIIPTIFPLFRERDKFSKTVSSLSLYLK